MQAQDRIATRNWYNIRLFPQQTFPLSINGQVVGLLVSGTGRHHKGDEDKCFLTLLESSRNPSILSTSSPDEGTNNTVHCGGVRALGLLPSHSVDQVRIGILYLINLPVHGNPNQHVGDTLAVVVAFDPVQRTLTIDQVATNKAQAAFPENLPALQQALSH